VIKYSVLFGIAVMIGIWATTTGCSFGAASISPTSHFAFPNSNVIPIGQASGSKTRLCGLLLIQWGSPDGDDQEAATQEALEKSGGDILINVRTDSQIFMIPYLFSLCITSVQGTAAKMEVGRQSLGAFTQDPHSGAPPPAAPPPAAQPVAGGCTSNNDCKGGRACVNGACAWSK
jgi:hypothetical protein